MKKYLIALIMVISTNTHANGDNPFESEEKFRQCAETLNSLHKMDDELTADGWKLLAIKNKLDTERTSPNYHFKLKDYQEDVQIYQELNEEYENTISEYNEECADRKAIRSHWDAVCKDTKEYTLLCQEFKFED